MADETIQFSPPLDVPAAYFNGFQIGLSNSDVSMIMLANGKPQMIANVSFTTAKSLHLALGELMKALETATTHDIMTMDEIASGLAKLSADETSAEEKVDG